MKFLRSIDYLGITPFLMYRENYCNKTIIGGILSIIISLIISLFFIEFLIMFLRRTKFSIYESQTKMGENVRFWSPEDFPIIVLDKYFNQIEESDRYFDIYAEIWTDKRITLENNTVISETIIVPIELIKCKITRYKNFDLWRDEKLINISTCFGNSIIKQKVNSTGNFGASGYTGIVIWVHLCNNSTEKNNCYPIDISKKKLENIFVYVKFYDYYFDHESYYNTSRPYIYSQLIQASSTSYQRIWFQSQKIIYKTDVGLFLIILKQKNIFLFHQHIIL